MRELVGPTDPALFDNPSRGPVYPELPEAAYDRVFDFGCGCGRLARRLIQQERRPRRYLGIDLHRGMIHWCQKNLQPRATGFEFYHHDVFHVAFNPGQGKAMTLPFPATDGSFTMVEAWSVFTHLTQDQAEHYLRECARVLVPGGVLHSTWFLFDRRAFPMLQDFQNALYTNLIDPSAAVIFCREWLVQTSRANGLRLTKAVAPEVRGFQWLLVMTKAARRAEEIELPEDSAPYGLRRPPKMPERADSIGLEAD